MLISMLPVLSSRSFIDSGLTFRSLIHFEFVFVYGIRKCSNFVLFHVSVQFSQHHLLKRPPFLHCIFLPPLSKIKCPQLPGFLSGISVLFHWSIFLFLWQHHTILMILALQCSLKSGRLIPPAPFFSLKTAFTVQGLSCLDTNCESYCSSFVKNAIGNLIGVALNL